MHEKNQEELKECKHNYEVALAALEKRNVEVESLGVRLHAAEETHIKVVAEVTATLDDARDKWNSKEALYTSTM